VTKTEAIAKPDSRSAIGVPPPQVRGPTRGRSTRALWAVFLLVFLAELAFGMWMNGRGFILIDAYSRSTSALLSLYSTDPHLAAIGFVWMPLPTMLQLLWVVFYPIWPDIVSSGFSSTFTTALAGGATAALLLTTARRLGFPDRFGIAYALLVLSNPMLFFYGTNGMSEGVAAPFLTGAVCFLVLFWRSGLRRYVTAAALALALGFASLYEAVPFGAALFAALAFGMLQNSENKPSAPQGRWRAIEGLGILFLVPSIYVGALWIGANAVIMGDPLFFATSTYSNHGQTAAVGGGGIARSVAGDVTGAIAFVVKRAMFFLVPGAFLLMLRALDGRFKRIGTLSLTMLLASVPFGLIGPLVFVGSANPYLRFYMYPLFVAAGWGLYEITLSRNPRRAKLLVLTGWIVAAPVILWAMATPTLGYEEHWQIRSVVTGRGASQAQSFNPETGKIEGFADWLNELAPVATYLKKDVLSDRKVVALDAFQGGAIAAQMPPEYLRKLLILTPDRRFKYVIRDPKKYGVSYFLVPDPKRVPQDALVQAHPGLWSGDTPGFSLNKSFPETPQRWRLYKIGPAGKTEKDVSFEAAAREGGKVIASGSK
jgi:hypothetical protein